MLVAVIPPRGESLSENEAKTEGRGGMRQIDLIFDFGKDHSGWGMKNSLEEGKNRGRKSRSRGHVSNPRKGGKT